jgi:peptidyl-tRNA hydrolase
LRQYKKAIMIRQHGSSGRGNVETDYVHAGSADKLEYPNRGCSSTAASAQKEQGNAVVRPSSDQLLQIYDRISQDGLIRSASVEAQMIGQLGSTPSFRNGELFCHTDTWEWHILQRVDTFQKMNVNVKTKIDFCMEMDTKTNTFVPS